MTPSGLWNKISLCARTSVHTSHTLWVSPLPRRMISPGCIAWRKSWACSPLSQRFWVASQSIIFLLANHCDWSHGHSASIGSKKRDKIYSEDIIFFPKSKRIVKLLISDHVRKLTCKWKKNHYSTSAFLFFCVLMSNHRKLIIIGSWPAGHTAAIYAWRANLAPLMFEWFMAWWVAAWWQLTTTTSVENFPWFPGGIQWPELMHRMREQSIESWCEIITKTVDAIDMSVRPFVLTVWAETWTADAVIVSTGATAKKLSVPGVDTYWMKGISGCAVCDGALPMFRNQVIAVVGWGDVAMEEAIHMSHFGSNVLVLVRSDKLRASKAMQAKAFANEKIEFLWNTEVEEVLGDGKKISWLRLVNNQSWEKHDIAVGGLFFAIGHTPNTWFLGWQVELDETGYIVTKPWTTQTSVPWLFAAGDVQDKKYRQAITSAWTWCMAALEAERRLQDQH